MIFLLVWWIGAVLIIAASSAAEASYSRLQLRTEGPGCTAVTLPLAPLGAGQSWSVQLGQLGDALCSEGEFRLEGNGDRFQAECSVAVSWPRVTLVQPAEGWWDGPATTAPLTLHVHSACAHPATVTLEVTPQPPPVDQALLHAWHHSSRSGFGSRRLLQQQGQAAGSARDQTSSSNSSSSSAGQQPGPLASNATSNGDGERSSGGNGGDSSSNSSSSSSSPGPWTVPSSPAGKIPPPSTSPEPMACCCRGAPTQPYSDPPPTGWCCCGAYKECCTVRSILSTLCDGNKTCGLAVILTCALVCCVGMCAVGYWMWKRQVQSLERALLRRDAVLAARGRPAQALVDALSELSDADLDGKAVTAVEDLEGIERECPVCLELLTLTHSKWMSFPCQHGVCYRCLQDLIKHNGCRVRHRDIVQCPLCREVAVGRVDEAALGAPEESTIGSASDACGGSSSYSAAPASVSQSGRQLPAQQPRH